MYLFSKLTWFVLQPLHLCLILAVLGSLLCALRVYRVGAALTLSGMLTLTLIAFTPIGFILLQPLEDCFKPRALPKRVDGILILGGGIDWFIANERNRLELSGAADRFVAAVELAKRYPRSKLVYTGFNPAGVKEGVNIHEALVQTLSNLGVRRENIVIEDRSRNTFENIKLSKALLKPRDEEVWVTVTSAFHMRRTMSLLQQANWRTIPYPVDFRSPGADSPKPFFKDSIDYIHNVNIATKEWLGLLVYRLSGKLKAISSCDPQS